MKTRGQPDIHWNSVIGQVLGFPFYIETVGFCKVITTVSFYTAQTEQSTEYIVNISGNKIICLQVVAKILAPAALTH